MNSKESRVAIKINGVKKIYKLGQIGNGTLQADLKSWWAKLNKREDPNSLIGEEERSNGKIFKALNGIDLTVYQGEALGIIGGNGAGKSTLLKILSRITAPSEGEIDINGRIASMLEVGTGFNAEMTGRENVYMNGAILGMSKAEIDSKMEEIIEFSEVREFIDTPVKRYSSGMFVKLAFSVAAHLDSEIMIMDEVLAVGDMAFQKKCLNKMRDAAKKEGRTVLYVSHNMNTIRQLCDRCVVLDKGNIIFDGDVEEAISNYLGVEASGNSNITIADNMRDQSMLESPIQIQQISIKCREGVIEFGQKLHFDIVLKNRKCDMKKVYVRVMLKNLDGTAVTMSISERPICVDSYSIVSKEFCFDISSIAPGNYTLSFVIFEMGAYGVDLNLEVIRDVYKFAIKPTEGFNRDIPWNSQWWGYWVNGDLKQIN